jgi:hypothetical protein
MRFTFNAVELMAEKLFTAFPRSYPGPYGPGWVMTDVLGMAAVEVRYPIAVFVLMKADNASFHLDIFCVRVLPGLTVRTR